QRPGRRGTRLGPGRLVIAGQHGLRKLDIPVTENTPDEVVSGVGRLVELVVEDGLRHRSNGPRRRAGDPAVELVLHRFRIEPGDTPTFVDLEEARGIPEFCDEVSIALDALQGQ